jgi:glycerophosphoryl diester phosphodiesterase
MSGSFSWRCTLFVMGMLSACSTIAGHGASVDCAKTTLLARLQSQPVAIVAHRGASGECPENTAVAFRRAVAAGADVVEFDVYQTRDGHWVCLHDATLDRTTNARQLFAREQVRIDELTLEDVQRLDAGSWFANEFAGEPVPTLAQALAAIAPALPMIERKGGDAAQLVAELRRLSVVDKVLVQAFDWDWLAAVHVLEPNMLLAALGGKDLTDDRLRDLDRTGASIVHWSHGNVTRAMTEAVHASGRLLCVYTVDADVAFYGAVAIGCELVTSNRPQHFVAERASGAFNHL